MTGKANWITSPEKNGRSALCFKKQFDINVPDILREPEW